MQKFDCPNCHSARSHIVQRQETMRIKNMDVDVKAKVAVCDKCGAEVFDPVLEEQNMCRAYNQYRRENGLLMPEEIKAIRKQYELNPATFSFLLGLDDDAISRFENGSLQSAAEDNLIRLSQDHGSFVELASFCKMRHQKRRVS